MAFLTKMVRVTTYKQVLQPGKQQKKCKNTSAKEFTDQLAGYREKEVNKALV